MQIKTTSGFGIYQKDGVKMNNLRKIICAISGLSVGLQSQLHILTHVFNTILADKMITDRLFNYQGWIRSMNLGSELADRTVEVLNTVTGRPDIP